MRDLIYIVLICLILGSCLIGITYADDSDWEHSCFFHDQHSRLYTLQVHVENNRFRIIDDDKDVVLGPLIALDSTLDMAASFLARENVDALDLDNVGKKTAIYRKMRLCIFHDREQIGIDLYRPINLSERSRQFQVPVRPAQSRETPIRMEAQIYSQNDAAGDDWGYTAHAGAKLDLTYGSFTLGVEADSRLYTRLHDERSKVEVLESFEVSDLNVTLTYRPERQGLYYRVGVNFQRRDTTTDGEFNVASVQQSLHSIAPTWSQAEHIRPLNGRSTSHDVRLSLGLGRYDEFFNGRLFVEEFLGYNHSIHRREFSYFVGRANLGYMFYRKSDGNGLSGITLRTGAEFRGYRNHDRYILVSAGMRFTFKLSESVSIYLEPGLYYFPKQPGVIEPGIPLDDDFLQELKAGLIGKF